jgi:hypothetical protein
MLQESFKENLLYAKYEEYRSEKDAEFKKDLEAHLNWGGRNSNKNNGFCLNLVGQLRNMSVNVVKQALLVALDSGLSLQQVFDVILDDVSKDTKESSKERRKKLGLDY